MEKFFVSVPIANYTKEGNELFRIKRVPFLTLNILLLWLNRFVVHAESHKNSEWFGGSEENGNFVFWFKLEKDAKKAENLLQHIKDNLVPSHSQEY